MQADTSMWNMGLVVEKQSDWGPLGDKELDAEVRPKIRRGLLYDYGFALWVS